MNKQAAMIKTVNEMREGESRREKEVAARRRADVMAREARIRDQYIAKGFDRQTAMERAALEA